jgi:DNA polymerase III epsilon subunit-like protein
LNRLFIDIETAGNSDRHAILEIAAIYCQPGHVAQKFNSILRRYEKKYDPEIMKISGITMDDLKKGSSAEKVAEGLSKMLMKTDQLIAHNVKYEKMHIKAFLDHYGLELNPKIDYLCTMQIAKEKISGAIDSFKLKKVANYFNIYVDGQHRASRDAEICMQIFNKLLVV